MIEHADIEQGLARYRGLAQADPKVLGELESSLSEFFGGPGPMDDPGQVLSSARRHLEWFLLERHSPALKGTPSERLLDRWRGEASDADAPGEELERALLESITGIFAVQGEQAGTTWVEDLAGLGAFPLRTPEGAAPLPEGDLIVGRLFPTDGGAYLVSSGAGIFRGESLREALDRDLAAIRDQGGPAILRISQLELEAMFFRAPRADAEPVQEPTSNDPVGDARKLLGQAGWPEPRIEDALAALKKAPFDPGTLVHGANDALASLLDELAFDSDVGLTEARTTLTHAWLALAREARERVQEPRDPREALAAFDAGRAAGRDLEALITDLEHDLGLAGPDVAAEPDTPAPDFPGVVRALVEEFLWDLGRSEPDASERHASLVHLATFGESIGVVDELNAQALLRFTAFWLPEQRALAGADEARALLESLRVFCSWAREHHDLPLGEEVEAWLTSLNESLPRIADAVRQVPPADASSVGELVEVLAPAPVATTIADLEGAHHAVRLDPAIGPELRPGDRLRGRRDGDRFEVLCVYPPEAAGLLQG